MFFYDNTNIIKKDICYTQKQNFFIKNIIKIMNESLLKDIKKLRNTMYPNGEYNKTNSLSIKKHFPLIYEKVTNFLLLITRSVCTSFFPSISDPDSVISYAARSHSQGNLYDALGFTFVKKTLPGFCWTKRNKRYNRSNFMNHKLVEMGHDKNKTTDEIMREQDYNKLWDYGNLLYQWKR